MRKGEEIHRLRDMGTVRVNEYCDEQEHPMARYGDRDTIQQASFIRIDDTERTSRFPHNKV
jgi:hypothetical protein